MDHQSLVTLIPWTFIAQICNLFIQVYLIKRFLFKPINQILEQRRQKADEDIRLAEEAKSEAEAIKAEYEQNIEQAKEKANEILVTAQQTANMQSEELLKETQRRTVAMREKAERDIAQERRKAVNEVKNEIGQMAVEIAGKVIEREISEDDHKQLIEEFIANVGEAS